MRKRYIYTALALFLSFGAQAQTGQSVLQSSAIDYMLQRPAVSKRYPEKHFLDRFFLEAGGGLTNAARRDGTAYVDWNRFGQTANVSFGDWLTPEHGVRLGLQGNLVRRHSQAGVVKSYGLNADYLMNLTAVGSRFYDQPHPLELVGVAGLDLLASHYEGTRRMAFGGHLGLRGQLNLSTFTYLYLEPRVTLYDDDFFHRRSRFGMRPIGSLTAGVGYRLVPGMRADDAEFKSTSMLLDNAFLSFSAGPAVIANAHREVWRHQEGLRFFAHLGKWFDGFNGLRLGLSVMDYNQGPNDENHATGGQISADYLLNLHNAFGGYNPSRPFFILGTLGASYSYLQTGNGKKWVPGVGAGMQANVRIGDFATFFVEPRVDLYQNKYAAYAYTSSHGDLVASLLMGVTLGQSYDMRRAQERNASFVHAAWYDHTFLEGSAGLIIPLRTYSLNNPTSSARPALRVGLGKWFAPSAGMRLRAEAAQAKWEKDESRTYVNLGADYLWNISNSSTGYRPDRKFELIGVLGLDAAAPRNRDHFYFGGNVGLKGLWNASRGVGFFVEPELYAYDNAFLPGTTASSLKLDLLASLTAGMQFNVNAITADHAKWYERDDQRDFYSLSAGGVASAIGLRARANMGGVGRVAFGRWYSPVSAWRVSAGTQAMRHVIRGRNHYSGKLFAGADYMTDLTTASFGEREDRVVSVRSVFGGNLALRYQHGTSYFCPDVHAGFQVAAAVGKGWEVFAEPQLAYQLEERMDDKAERLLPNLQLGLNYSFRRGDQSPAQPDGDNFAELSLGTGAYSATVTRAPLKRKFTFAGGAAYGRYFGERSALRVGYERTHIQKRTRHGKSTDINTLHADYMLSLLPHDAEQPFHLRAAAGLTLNTHSMADKTRFAPGAALSLQASYEVTPHLEVFLEPKVDIYAKTITTATRHPMEGAGKLLLGTRLSF